MENYWNDNYWRRHLAEPERMDIFEDLWIEKHQALIDKLYKGNVLDLGCGIGQFKTLSLEEIHTVYFRRQRDHWEFIFQKKGSMIDGYADI